MNSNGDLCNSTSMLSGAAEAEEDSIPFGMIKSPGSLLGSSIRSNQVESFDMESESCSVTEENPGWKLGMPWFSNNNNQNKNLRIINLKAHEDNRYYGGIMKASAESSSTGPATPSSTTSTISRDGPSFRQIKKSSTSSRNESANDNRNKSTLQNQNGRNSINRAKKNKRSGSRIDDEDNVSVPIARTKSNTVDSIGDFDDSEWTPPDSSYGAACPVCGCIPKRVRQMVEMTLIAAMVFFLIYLLVTTSMKIADAHRSQERVDGSDSGSTTNGYFSSNNYNRTGTSSTASTNVVTDDDDYVEKNNNDHDNDDGGNGDYVIDEDDNYNDDYGQNPYTNDDNGNDGSDYSQDYNYYSDVYQNRRYYQYTDDYNDGGRQLRSLRRRNINVYSGRQT
mmetsp:Transcript_11066/g.26581  ORF Transcript_11066/g.26581 Transcript_11066/m.26581 type:complete len:393 (-) Transcript_11066:481-1659(-)